MRVQVLLFQSIKQAQCKKQIDKKQKYKKLTEQQQAVSHHRYVVDIYYESKYHRARHYARAYQTHAAPYATAKAFALQAS